MSLRLTRLGAHARTALVVCAVGVVLTGCSAGQDAAASPAPSDSPSATATPSPAAATPSTPASGAGAGGTADYTELCDANREAAAAKTGTVGQDLAAAHRQADAIAALLPMTGVSPEVAAGATVFADSTAELIGILEQYPADTAVVDIALDDALLQSQALDNVATNIDYQAFIAWTIETCYGTVLGE
ncbi:hypothetical protein [Microbacterium sp. Yaish 1]|uniref:hypothetical protein n=1 Tax=Microbacterium sp. Yaish 1 TaxID=2025014 RepID=UPI000B9F3702|nr:hypothetical protein [Microbacterium sp. Yaish 1]OYC97139.1 hypothetical protein CI089_00830 [Microbacterium sp. Yaish 1]